MNLVYLKFLFIQTIKRRPVWVTWILFLFAIACFLIILPAASKIETLQLWANTTVSFTQTIMAMIAGVFTAILAINIFRDTQEEGTELIVISKPITRNKIVLTKFLVFGLICLMVNITAVILTSFTILLPETEKTYFAGLVISMFIGNAVVFAIMGAISILTSVKWAKIGVIVTNLLITLFLLIFQILSAFVFKTPAQALNSKHAAVSSYIYADRDMETGEYTEKNLVDFSADNTVIKHEANKAITWKDVEQFWVNDIKGIDPSKILNATDFASQVALTYSTYDLHNFSKRQAKRMFGMSRYYDYDLVKPISPENIGIDSKVYWLWGWPRAVTTPDESKQLLFYLPGWSQIPAIESYDINTLKGLTDKLPIGVLHSNEGFFGTDVLFEPEDWQRYAKGFNQIYKYAFDYSVKTKDSAPDAKKYYYDLDGLLWYDWMEAIFRKTENFKALYELIWHFLMGRPQELIQTEDGEEIVTDYNIHSVTDLNTRYAQFKYYLLFRLYQEEQDILNNLPRYAGMAQQAQLIYDQLKNNNIPVIEQKFEEFFGVELSPSPQSVDFKGFYMECAKDENGEYIQNGLLVPGTRVPCYDWIWKTAQEPTQPYNYDDPIIKTSPRNRYCCICTTNDKFVIPKDTYMFDSLDGPSRSDKFTFSLNYASNYWNVNPDCELFQYLEIPSEITSATSFFEYTMTARTKNWIFVVIWGTIAMAGYAAGSVIYKKYDVK